MFDEGDGMITFNMIFMIFMIFAYLRWSHRSLLPFRLENF